MSFVAVSTTIPMMHAKHVTTPYQAALALLKIRQGCLGNVHLALRVKLTASHRGKIDVSVQWLWNKYIFTAISPLVTCMPQR